MTLDRIALKELADKGSDADLLREMLAFITAQLMEMEVEGLTGAAYGARTGERTNQFLRTLTRRGLRGVKLVISDAHEGLKAAAAKVLSATWQRCRVHFMRNALAHVGVKQRPMVAAAIRTAFEQESAEDAHAEWRIVADRLRPRFRGLGELMDEAEHDVLAYRQFPPAHRRQLHSTNPLERLNGEIKKRTRVVGIFPNEAAIVRLVGAILLEQNDEWAVTRRYMSLETFARLGYENVSASAALTAN